MIVQTFTGKRGTVVDVSPPDTPPEAARVYVRLWLTVPGPAATTGRTHPPARVIVAYHPADVVEVRALPGEEQPTGHREQ